MRQTRKRSEYTRHKGNSCGTAAWEGREDDEEEDDDDDG